jgi:hypothetical protein
VKLFVHPQQQLPLHELLLMLRPKYIIQQKKIKGARKEGKKSLHLKTDVISLNDYDDDVVQTSAAIALCNCTGKRTSLLYFVHIKT